MQDPKSRQKVDIWAPLHNFVGLYLRNLSTRIDNRKKNLLSSNMSFGPLAAEIGPVVWGTPAHFNGFRVLAALLHRTPVLGVSQTLRH